MIVYFQYAVTWLFFMSVIVGICLITPKLAKKIDQWREVKKDADKCDKEQIAPDCDTSVPSDENKQ